MLPLNKLYGWQDNGKFYKEADEAELFSIAPDEILAQFWINNRKMESNR